MALSWKSWRKRNVKWCLEGWVNVGYDTGNGRWKQRVSERGREYSETHGRGAGWCLGERWVVRGSGWDVRRKQLERILWRQARLLCGGPCMLSEHLGLHSVVSKDAGGVWIQEWHDPICIWEVHCGGNMLDALQGRQIEAESPPGKKCL